MNDDLNELKRNNAILSQFSWFVIRYTVDIANFRFNLIWKIANKSLVQIY